MKYSDHKSSKYCLGPNWEQAIEDLIQIKVEQIGLDFYADKKTGEIDFLALRKFQSVEQEVCAACHQKVNQYFRHVTAFRQKNTLNPFNPERETRDRIRSVIDGKHFKYPSFRKFKMPEPKIAKSTDHMSVRELAETMQIKSEYQGKNHPLEVSQVHRTQKCVPASEAAISALHQFDTTGKIVIPYCSKQRIKQNDREYLQWIREMPISTKPIREAEPLEFVINDVISKLKKEI